MRKLNIKRSRANIIHQLLSFEGLHVQTPVYKKTAEKFKKDYGVELHNAPIVLKANGYLWLLSHNVNCSRFGRDVEKAEYNPVVSCGRYFERLKVDIKITN